LHFPGTKGAGQPSVFCLTGINERLGSIAPTLNSMRTRRRKIETRELVMTGKHSAEVPNMRQRTVLQYLTVTDWRMVNRLPVSAGEVTLSRLIHHRWNESRGEKQRTAVRLTPGGSRRCGRLLENHPPACRAGACHCGVVGNHIPHSPNQPRARAHPCEHGVDYDVRDELCYKFVLPGNVYR